MALVRKAISKSEIARLTRSGFTVTSTAITGGTDALLARRIVGGKRTVTQLKRLTIRA